MIDATGAVERLRPRPRSSSVPRSPRFAPSSSSHRDRAAMTCDDTRVPSDRGVAEPPTPRRGLVRIAMHTALCATALAACAASLPTERRDYILSRPHGWVELSISDLAIPLVPESEEAGAALVRPPACGVEIELDREPFVGGAVYPNGEQAPFMASSGYRFPAPVGSVHLALRYSDCRVAAGKAAAVTAEADLAIGEGQVTEIAFDGERLAASAPRADRAVTLESIYEAVTGHARPTP